MVRGVEKFRRINQRSRVWGSLLQFVVAIHNTLAVNRYPARIKGEWVVSIYSGHTSYCLFCATIAVYKDDGTS